MAAPPLDQTFGIELEFICVRPQNLFLGLLPHLDPQATGDVGAVIYHSLVSNRIPATGWEPLEDVDDEATINDLDHPSYSRWMVSTDTLELSEQEQKHLPAYWVSESIELSSRKFSLLHDDWRGEIAAVTQILRQIEGLGCRFIANASTGFHVHVGNGMYGKVPLQTAKGVFQIATALESHLDVLHPIDRFLAPDDSMDYHFCHPLSYFHMAHEEAEGTAASLPGRLTRIQRFESYEELGEYFHVPSHNIPSAALTGHHSSYNFDNLFADPEADRWDDTLTGTIEFRQHRGTLDTLEITAWILLTCQMVCFANRASPVELLDLCLRGGMDVRFGIEDALRAIGCAEEVIEHFVDPEAGPIGFLPAAHEVIGRNPSPTIPSVDGIVETNDEESEELDRLQSKGDAITLKWAMGAYGIDTRREDVTIAPAFARQQYATACEMLAGVGIDAGSEYGRSMAMGDVLMWMDLEYVRGKSDFR